MEIKKLSADQDFQSVINNINDYLKKINDYQVNHQSEFGLPIEELGQFRKSWFYNNWQARFRKIQSFNGLGLTGVINTPNTTFDEWLWWFHEWAESFMDDYNQFKELMLQALLVIEKHLEAVDSELQDHETRISDHTNRLDADDVKINQHEQQLDGLSHDLKNHIDSKGVVTEFETLNDLKQADLSSGQYVVTLHGLNSNDSNGAHYVISNTVGDGAVQLNNGLYANRYETDWNVYYDDTEIYSDWRNINHTIVNEVHVHQKDSEGNYIVPQVVRTDLVAWNPDAYALKSQSTLTINGSLAYCTDAGGKYVEVNDPTMANLYINGAVVGNGQILHEIDERTLGTLPPTFTYVGFKDDGEYGNYPANDWTAQQMVSDGVKNAFMVFAKVVTDGAAVDLSNFHDQAFLTTHNYRTAIGFKANGTMIIVSSDGLTISNRGLTVAELVAELISLGAKDAWLMDGGGSASIVLRGARLNGMKDTHNDLPRTQARGIEYSVTFKKPLATKGAVTVAAEHARSVQQSLINQIELMRYTYDSNKIVSGGDYDVKNDTELEDALNKIKEHIPTDTFNNVLKVVGTIFVNYTNSAIYKSLGDGLATLRSAFRYEFYRDQNDGEWDYKWIKVVSVQENLTAWNIWSPQSNKWLGWHAEGVGHWVDATITNSGVTDLEVFHSSGGVINVSGKITTASAPKSWTAVASGMPFPKYVSTQTDTCVDTTLRNAVRLFVGSDGKLYVRYIQFTDDTSRDLAVDFSLSYAARDAIHYANV